MKYCCVISTPTDPAPYCWENLSRNLKGEKAILQSRNTPESLQKVFEDGFAVAYVIQYDGAQTRSGVEDVIIGFLAAWPVTDGFCEIGSAWVDPGMRGHGIGKKLYRALKKLPKIQDQVNFGITTNPISVHLGGYANLKPHKDWQNPIPWNLTCGPCDYIAECDKASCTMRNTSCWLRVMKK